MPDTVILAASRTPLGAFRGALAQKSAAQLGAVAIVGALSQIQLAAGEITDVLLGNVLQAGQGQAPARQAALAAGLPASVRTATINKVCGSGLQSVLQATHALQAGMGRVFVAGGMESMSRAPYLLVNGRTGFRLGHQEVLDSLISDGLWDPHCNLHMGSCAERCARHYGFTREEQDAYAITSYRRAEAAQREEKFAHEITAVEVATGRGAVDRVTADEGLSRVKYDRIPTLKPAFAKNGTITVANASSLNDGAAALVVSARATAEALSVQPRAKIVAFGVHAQEPEWFTTAPVPAVRSALAKAGWSVDDVDLWEVNEAFAVVPLALMRELGVSHDRVNVRGGAIALGHPLGASGARIVVTLLDALRERGLKRGIAAVCIGGGEGIAMAVELL